MTQPTAYAVAMRRALDLARAADVPPNPNPRVGCVLLDADGAVVGEGAHHGAGTPHAEVEALRVAGAAARGGTAVVTLEPCAHTGRTGPCTQALREAGVVRVVFGQPDPNPDAAGGAAVLQGAGVEVVGGVLAEEARGLNAAWSFSVERGRPYVTWKLATTLDGRSAAADGTSRWVSSRPARRDTHRLRAVCDAIMVGTETVLVDDPELTVRDEDDVPLPRARQLLRVVMGLRDVPADRRVRNDAAETLLLATRDPREALSALAAREVRHLFLEGGPTLAAAFLRAGLVDEVVCYVAPMLLGAGRLSVGDLGVTTIADAHGLHVDDVTVLGEGEETNVRLTMTPLQKEA